VTLVAISRCEWTANWLAGLPWELNFILVVLEEWEIELPDWTRLARLAIHEIR
jgi:hypothetical protein